MSDAKPTLLVVDDAPINIDVLLETLSDDYVVRVAGDGASALSAVKKALPDLILLDVMMPDVDGFEVCRRLKEDPISRSIPVIFLTALAEDADEERGLRLGAVDYITKPFNPVIVKARVRTHLELKAHRNALEALVEQRTCELAAALDRLRVLDIARREYLSAIAHELRTPAHGVLGIAELMLSGLSDDEPHAQYKALFSASKQRLLTTIDAALQLAQLGADDGSLTMAAVDISALVAKTAGSLGGVFLARDLSFIVPSTSPHVVFGHEVLLRQSVATLLKVAQRLASPGTTVAAQCRDEQDRTTLGIVCECPPVSEALQRTFFDTFSYSRSSSVVEDLGLTAPLASHMVRVMGGSVDLRNTASGVEISLTLPRDRQV